MSANDASRKPKPVGVGIEKLNPSGLPSASAAAHPEEMTASVDLRIGRSVSLQATARTTPAGLVAVGFMTATIVLAIAVLFKVRRRGST
ncbi:hypothetical protein Msil_0732 [Methylocella silvestris BL2]|uniref:Uncharacterized protein n=1 Tax=Methylocella silvestris (strain DSM 15510 / CIP 108128 / LMG 27833 / NCIMB 13906 / BL2) TaxID=395965 RepID=B8EPB5_METSB|nr:hypothetical protein [Methylocella silvestris]ACK49703.1 hypothetical protein Msil_0732 [Methylocella silvestris BL2]